MRPSAVLAIAIALVALLANVADLLFLDFFGGVIVVSFALATFTGVGLVLALLRPHHPVGWLFLVGGACFALGWFALPAYAWRAFADAPGEYPGGELAAWAAHWIWFAAIGSVIVGILLFPSGRPPSRRWGVVFAVVVAALAAMVVAAAIAPVQIKVAGPWRLDATVGLDRVTFPNPYGARGAFGELLVTALPFLQSGIGVPLLITVLALLIWRFARSSGTERLQLKWFFYAAGFAFTLVIGGFFVGPMGGMALLAYGAGMTAMGLIPVAAGIAVLRYRLYDIDLLINRTLVYGALSATLGLAYFAAVAVLGAALQPLTGGSELAVAASTLAVVALFTPLRRRIQAAVDRRFYRSRYDAAQTLDDFSVRLRDQVDIDAVRTDLLDAVRETVQPAHASVWLRERAP